MELLASIFKFLVTALGLAPKVVDAVKSPELGPPPPAADKDALMKDLKAAKEKKFGGGK